MLDQTLFKTVDFRISTLPFDSTGKALYPFHQYPAIPGTVKNTDIIIGLQLGPEAPQVGSAEFILFRSSNAMNFIFTRIEFFYNTLDRAALAGRIHTFEQNHHITRIGTHRLGHLSR